MSSNDERDEDRPTALTSADPVRNFTLTVDQRIRALAIGVPAYAARKRKIEDQEARWVSDLVELHGKLAGKGKSPAEIERALEKAAAALRFERVNALIADHNRYYPIEANLPLDHATRDYVVYRDGARRRWKPEAPYTPDRVLGLARARLGLTDHEPSGGD